MIVEDPSLARKIHAQGMRWRVVHVADLITCQMYHCSQEALDGFSKNFITAFDFRLFLYVFAFSWLGAVYILPLLIIGLYSLGIATQAQPGYLASCVILERLSWMILYLHLRLPLWLADLYPVTVLANQFSANRSLYLSLRGELIWKGRTIQPERWKLF
jgi:chlorobactene glucosyltransferase